MSARTHFVDSSLSVARADVLHFLGYPAGHEPRPRIADLLDEFNDIFLPIRGDKIPSESELRIAQAQLIGWLEGLFHGIQASLWSQQMAAQAQLAEMQQRQLGPSQPDQATGLYL